MRWNHACQKISNTRDCPSTTGSWAGKVIGMKDPAQRIHEAIRDVQDFPEPGIVFKDITPVLQDADLFRLSLNQLMLPIEGLPIDKVVGIDARGFIFGAPVAMGIGAGFVPIRKKGKLPYACLENSYELEYGKATVEIHKDAIKPGERVLLVDDLLATGGTAAAAIKLLSELGADLVACHFLIELDFLKGREKLPTEAPVRSILNY